MNAAPAARPKTPKQAVLLVHGMGEQMPMETLRGFVETMWVSNTAIAARRPGDPPEVGNPVWWKPDSRTGSLELSRITTRHGDAPGAPKDSGKRTDFFEFYWADLTDANTVIQLKDWFVSLLWRSPAQVPYDVMPVWWLLWLLTLAVGGVAVWFAAAQAGLAAPWTPTAKGFFALAGIIYSGLILRLALSTFGDVARYVRPAPPNIAARRAIRERGLALLRQLVDSGDYDRIVLVAHSLGSIIAYDLLRFLWSEGLAARTMTEGDALHQACLACQDAAAALNAAGAGDIAARFADYRAAQGAVAAAMRAAGPNGRQWLISDFVTLGSPLTHAPFLLAHDDELFRQGITERRFPASPPVFEDTTFLYRDLERSPADAWQMHHAAVFAAVRWTNLYDPAHAIAFGDLIGGPVGPSFGRGIQDVPVAIRRARWLFPQLFTHTLYWTATGPHSPHLDRLRTALSLLRS